VNCIRITALVGAAVLASTAAFAGDPNSRIPAVAMSAFNWSGFYAGVNAGGSWYNGGGVTNPSNVATIIPPANIIRIPTSGDNSAGFTGGGLAGYNYQIGQIVLGAETDFNYLGLRSQRGGSTTVPVMLFETETLSITGRSQIDWFGTLRVRFGALPVERLLLYGTGGLAYGKVETSEVDSNTFSSIFIQSVPASRLWQGSNSEVKLGWTAGAGTEYALTPKIAVRAEYLYVDIGKSSAVATFQGTGLPQSQIYYTAIRDNKFSVARVAISSKF
jgi:outer membrane immunogenic protein